MWGAPTNISKLFLAGYHYNPINRTIIEFSHSHGRFVLIGCFSVKFRFGVAWLFINLSFKVCFGSLAFIFITWENPQKSHPKVALNYFCYRSTTSDVLNWNPDGFSQPVPGVIGKRGYRNPDYHSLCCCKWYPQRNCLIWINLVGLYHAIAIILPIFLLRLGSIINFYARIRR